MSQSKKANQVASINLKLEKGILDLQLNMPLTAFSKWLLALVLMVVLNFMPELWQYVQVISSLFHQ